jgi:hypothetical protein
VAKLWVLTLLLLPVTTLPLLALGQTVAKPIAIVPATLLIAIVFLLDRRRRQVIFGTEAATLYTFCVWSLASYGALAIMSGGVPEREVGDFVRGFSALLVGVVFYLGFRAMNLDKTELRKSETVIFLALSISIAVALLQFVADMLIPALRPLVMMLNYVLVDVSTAWSGRYHGLAYEPSWLGSQITVLMLPLLVSRWVTGETFSRGRLGPVSFGYEAVLLGIAVTGVVLSGSRTALLSTVAILVVAFLSLGHVALLRKSLPKLIAIGALVSVVAVGSLSNAYVLSAVQGIGSKDILELAERTSSAPRVSLWLNGLSDFQNHPVAGVGLGNSLVHYRDNVPAWALAYPEVQLWMADPSLHLNPKNMLVKLLAETGLGGFALFAVFVGLHFRLRISDPRYIVLRNTAAVALLFNYFSLDTFALPTEWFLLGAVLVCGTRTVRTRAVPAPADALQLHNDRPGERSRTNLLGRGTPIDAGQ